MTDLLTAGQILKPLSNWDIDKFFNRGQGIRRTGLSLLYGGCIAKDQLHLEERKLGPLQHVRKFWIINLDNSSGAGTHWTMLSFLNTDVGVYFDSFAVDCPQQVLAFMKKHRARNVMNEAPVQDMDSITCGYFACYVAEQLCQGRLYMDIIAEFSSNTAQNEAFIRDWANKSGLRAK